MVLRSILAFLAVIVPILGNTQTLTISSSGQTAPGTNWSFSGNTITVTGTANIAASYIQDKLAIGELSIVGNTTDFSVYSDQAISSTATNTLYIGASNNTGTVSIRSTLTLGGSLGIIAGEVSFLEALTLTGSGSLSVTSLNTVVNATVTIAGNVSISSTGNFILGTNISAGSGYPFAASGGFAKTGAGTSYLFSDIITTNSAVSISGPVVIGNFNTTSTTTEIKSNGGSISMPGAVSAYTGSGRDYLILLYSCLFDADGGMVTGSTTEMFLRFNAGSHLFNGLPGMPSTIAMQYLVVGGGGGGGNSSSGAFSGGGGGGGGVADGSYNYNGTAFNLVVGAGGSMNTNGSDSYLATIKSGGGGAGGNWNNSVGLTGNGGASYAAGGGGGGHGSNVNTTAASGGSGTQRSGGSGANCCSLLNYGGSGGGATGNASGYNNGGAGYSSSITGATVTYGSGAACQGTPVAKTGGGGGALHYGTVQGANGTIIIRFTLPNASTLNAQTSTSLLHINAGAGGITLGSTVSNLSSLTVTSDGTTSIAGLITGSGSFTKAGSSTLTLSGNHTYSGGTIVNGGILALNDIYNNGQGVIRGELTVNQNGTVQLTGLASALGHHLTQRVSKININGGLIDANSGQQHVWNLDGGLTFNGGGTLRSNGGISSATATSYLEWGVGSITVTNPTSPAVIAGRINLRSDFTGGAVTFNVSDGTADNDLLISAAITQTSAPTIAKTGTGKITFTGANTHTSVTTISAGVFQVGAAGATGSISGSSVVNNATIVFNRNDDFTISNVISGSGTIEKLGAGVLTLSGANTYTGATTISAGTLKLGSTTALGTIAGATVVSNGTALDLNGITYGSAEPLTISGTGLSAGGVVFNASATAASFPGPITLAAASLVKCSTGNITLSGALNGAFTFDVQGTSANYTQSGIIGAIAPPTAFSVNTGSGQTTISANTTVAGPVTIDAGQISMNSTIASSLSNAALTFRSQKFINHTGTTGLTLNANGGNILLAANTDDATDNDATVNGYILFSYGLTINSSGGNITLGGGDATASTYALGTSAYPYEGVRIDGTVNINSGGGNIIMRGKSYAISTTAGAWGVGFWNLSTGTISSGTGTILLDGFSQSWGGTHNAGIYSYGALTITSANTTTDAIRLIGKATGVNGESTGLEIESNFSVLATADGGGITISSSQQVANFYDVIYRGETNILAKSGPIQLIGKQDGGVANGIWYLGNNLFLGSKALSTVPTSSSPITIEYDRYDFSNLNPKVATTGTFNWRPAATSFGQNIQTDYFSWNQNSQTITGLTLGKSGNTANVTLNSVFTVAGPISVYGGLISVSSALTSSATGDILLKGITNSGSCLNVSAAITKTAGTGTLLMQGHGRANVSSAISATGTASLNVILWSDFDSDNVGGGSTISSGASISTNGGHVWLGGSNSNGGSYTWNGLTVGDGPSTGSPGANCNAIDLFGPITTANGDVLLWASNNGGCGTSGIVSDVSRHINAGSGDITFIADQTAGTIELTSTGIISLLPEAGSYGSALTLGGTITSGHFSFNTSFYNGLKINSLASTGLVVGNYLGHFSGAAAITQSNSSNMTVSSALSGQSLELFGGTLTLSAALSTTAGNMSLNGSTIVGTPTLTLSTGSTLTMNLSSNTTFAGSIVGTGLNLVKDGAGILALTASNAPTFANVTISGGTYRLNANQQLTLSGVLTNNGTFTMRDGATLVQATSGTSITGSGTYNVQKFVSGNSSTWNTTTSGRYWYMGVPMSSTTRNAFGAYNINSNRVWSYSEATKQYTHLTDNNATLNAGTGYVHRRASNDTLTFTATGANGLYGADFSLSNLTRTSGVSAGYHLIANPYMAYLDWNAISKTNVEPTYYIRSNNANVDISALISYNAGTNLYTNTSSVTTTAGQLQYIAPLQSIWIRVGAAAATGGLAMDRTMLSHQSGNPGLKSSSIFPTLARVNLVDGARFDQMLVYMNPDMTNGVDQYDSEKMFVTGAPQLYTMAAGKKLVMNGLKNNKSKISLPLYLELPESKIYNLQLAEYLLEDGLILLEDKQEGTIQDFTIHDVYSFYANSGVLQNRFILHFYMPDNVITAQGPSNSWVEEEAVINEGGNILVNSNGRGKVSIQQDIDPSPAAKGSVVVRDAAGREVWKGQLSGSATTLELDTPSGIYFVEVELNGQVELKKIFVQQ